MKRLLCICFFSLFSVINANSQLFMQKDDVLFARNQTEKIRGDDGGDPGGGGGEPTPIGSGIAVLLCLSAGYVCIKRSRKKDK